MRSACVSKATKDCREELWPYHRHRPPANPCLWRNRLHCFFRPSHCRTSPKGIGTVQYCPSSGSYHHRMFRLCEKGPIVKIIPDNTFYIRVTPEDVDEIITKHIINGHRVERLLYIDPKTERVVSDSKHMDFYRKQQRIALRNCGFINPEI